MLVNVAQPLVLNVIIMGRLTHIDMWPRDWNRKYEIDSKDSHRIGEIGQGKYPLSMKPVPVRYLPARRKTDAVQAVERQARRVNSKYENDK